MSQHLSLDIPDELFASLEKAAAQTRSTPEQVAAKRLAEDARRREEDPLLKLLGSIDSDISDVAENHDKYIGEGLMAETRRTGE